MGRRRSPVFKTHRQLRVGEADAAARGDEVLDKQPKARSKEEAEIRKVEAETAYIRVRTRIVVLVAAFLFAHLLTSGSILPEHGDLIGRLLP
jgi:hypothetical protein